MGNDNEHLVYNTVQPEHGTLACLSQNVTTVGDQDTDISPCDSKSGTHVHDRDTDTLNSKGSWGGHNSQALGLRPAGVGFQRVDPDPYTLTDHSCDVPAPDFNTWVIRVHEIVKKTGVPNYRGSRIQVPSDFNLPLWFSLLKDSTDAILFDYIRFGFPLALDYIDFEYNLTCDNHSLATEHPKDVNIYLNKEVSYNAMAGPYTVKPIERLHVSPLLTREKPNDSRQVIVNLSYLYHNSVNSNIAKHLYDGYEFTLKYPSVDDIVSAVADIGSSALL